MQLAEDDPVAVALGYRHDAAQVDTARYSRYGTGMACRNCVQFQGAEGDEWGGCGLFPD